MPTQRESTKREKVTQPVHVGEHPFPDRFDTREREDLAFHKRSERLELLDLRVADPKHVLVDRVVRCGQLAAEIEEPVL